jgi:hypothetical protein
MKQSHHTQTPHWPNAEPSGLCSIQEDTLSLDTNYARKSTLLRISNVKREGGRTICDLGENSSCPIFCPSVALLSSGASCLMPHGGEFLIAMFAHSRPACHSGSRSTAPGRPASPAFDHHIPRAEQYWTRLVLFSPDLITISVWMSLLNLPVEPAPQHPRPVLLKKRAIKTSP